MTALEEKLDSASAIIREALTTHRVVKSFVMFSGGRDSLATAFATWDLLPDPTLLHINTGIGIRQTREFVRATAKAQGWPLLEVHPPGRTFEGMVGTDGMPGPAAHFFTYVWLKERAVKAVVRAAKKQYGTGKQSDRVLLVTGVRREESRRRMGHVEPIYREGARLWCAPLSDWTGLDTREYLAARRVQHNPVSDILGYSGECLCGAYAKPGERDLIRTFYPEAEAEIVRLEALAASRGLPCRWGERPPGTGGKKPKASKLMPLCVGCEGGEEGA